MNSSTTILSHKQSHGFSVQLFVIAAALLLSAASPSFASDGDKPAPGPAASSAKLTPSATTSLATSPTARRVDREKKVFTNDDIDAMFPRPDSAPPQSIGASTSLPASPFAPQSSIDRANANQAAADAAAQRYAAAYQALSAELDSISAREQSLRDFRANGTGDNLHFGLQIYAPCEGITTDNAIQQLAIRRNEIARQLDELADSAHQSGLPSGYFNQASANLQRAAASPAQQAAALAARQSRLADELNGVQSELSGMSDQAAQQGISLLPANPNDGGNMTTNLVNDLNNRASQLSSAIAANEDAAREASIASPAAQ